MSHSPPLVQLAKHTCGQQGLCEKEDRSHFHTEHHYLREVLHSSPRSPETWGVFTTLVQLHPVVILATKLCLTLWFLGPQDFPGKNTGVGCHFLLHGIFSNQELNPRLLHWQVDPFTTEP